MTNEAIEALEKLLQEITFHVKEAQKNQDIITQVFMDNFERFADRITKIEVKLFGKSED